MFDTKSDYALNKRNPDAIVCRSVTGKYIRLTCEDFASDEEFSRWKDWSDREYHETEKADHVFHNHTLPTEGLSESSMTVLSAEDVLMETFDQQERQKLRCLLMEGLDRCLTQPQSRRIRLYYIDGLTMRQIAEIEGVQHQSIVHCLAAAKRNLQKFLQNSG